MLQCTLAVHPERQALPCCELSKLICDSVLYVVVRLSVSKYDSTVYVTMGMFIWAASAEHIVAPADGHLNTHPVLPATHAGPTSACRL